VNAGYITRPELLEDHLRRQQQAVSSTVFAALTTNRPSIRQWLKSTNSRLLDPRAHVIADDMCGQQRLSSAIAE